MIAPTTELVQLSDGTTVTMFLATPPEVALTTPKGESPKKGFRITEHP